MDSIKWLSLKYQNEYVQIDNIFIITINYQFGSGYSNSGKICMDSIKWLSLKYQNEFVQNDIIFIITINIILDLDIVSQEKYV